MPVVTKAKRYILGILSFVIFISLFAFIAPNISKPALAWSLTAGAPSGGQVTFTYGICPPANANLEIFVLDTDGTTVLGQSGSMGSTCTWTWNYGSATGTHTANLVAFGYSVVATTTVNLSGGGGGGGSDTPKQLADLITVIKNVVSILVPAAGIAFFFMLLLGGVQFLLSGGDPKSVAAARNTMTYAIIGVILVVVSWLVLLVLNSTLGIDLTTVSFPIS